MKAAITLKPGLPEVIQYQEVPKPEVKTGELIIKVKVLGLDPSELVTQPSHSPGVVFPRIQVLGA